MNRLAARAPLLIDFGDVPEAHCDACLDGLFKAIAANPSGEEAAIWQRHDNPWIADHVEDVTRWAQRILEAMQDALAAAMTGRPIGHLAKALPWERPDEAEREAIRADLAARPAATWTLDDWLTYAELLIADLLPDGVIREMSDFITVRSYLTGKVAATLARRARPILPGQARKLALATPVSRRNLPPKFLTPVERAILDVATERAATFISDLQADARKRIKTLVIEGVQRTVLGESDGGDERMRSRIFDEFGQLNRDFRRIAVTESGEAHNTGFIGGQPVGSRVRRVEAYKGACEFCRSINGRVFRVADPADPKRDGETDVWVGKSNVGRSASPKKREGGILVDRAPGERWWVASGVMHPHCRGRWVPAPAQADDPRHDERADAGVMDWLRAEMQRAGIP